MRSSARVPAAGSGGMAEPKRSRGSKRRRSAARSSAIESRLLAPVSVSALAALLIRIVYLADASKNPFWRELGLDMQIYHEWAQALMRGAPPGPFLQAPLFPYLLAIAYGALGPDPVRALWFHLVPGTLTVAGIAWGAGRWCGPLAAWIAGLFAALYAPAIFYTGVLLPPTWVLFLSTLVLLLGVESLRGRAGRGRALLTGVAAGLLTLAQPLALALALPLFLITPRGVPRWRAAMLLGLLVPLSITFLYNGTRGAWTPIAVNGGINLYVGNGPQANGGYSPPPGLEENRDMLGIEIARAASHPSGSAVESDDGAGASGGFTAADADRYWRREALAAMTHDPGRTIALFGRKLLLFFGQYEVPQIESFSFEKQYSALLQIPLPGMALLVALGTLGAILCAGDRVARWLALSALSFAIATALFFVTARFRLPVAPWLTVLAAAGIVRAVELVRTRQMARRAILGATSALLVFVLLSSNVLGIDAAAARGQYSFRQGLLSEKAGRPEEAIVHYREALQDDANLAKANVNLGTLLARQGQVEQAIPYLEAGARLDPGSGTALQNLGQAYQVLGRDGAALAQFQKAVLAQPDLISAREGLAYLHYATGNIKEARQSLQTILFQAPKGTPPALRAGTLLAIMDERTELLRQLTRSEGGRALDPQWWRHSELLGADLALAQRRLDDARRGYRTASADPKIAPYAHNVLQQMTETLGAPAP